MNKIQYQILRYLPDRVSGEFVNLGIVAFDPVEKKLEARFITKIGNISALFPNINSRYLIKSVKTIQEHTERIASRLFSEFSFEKKESLSAITQTILPKDDSALIFSEVKMTLDVNVQSTVQDLFTRFIKTHLLEEDDEVRRDKEVWNKVYKKHFDDYGISSHFHAHTVKTKNDELEFERAWKNGAWNCFETVSFNLSRPDSIKNKVYKWVGKLDELNSAKEPLHIYLLSVLPHDHPELTNFITKKIKSKSTDNARVQIVSEKEIEGFAKKIKREIDSH
jgi:Protein of unknown function (DUF3037)